MLVKENTVSQSNLFECFLLWYSIKAMQNFQIGFPKTVCFFIFLDIFIMLAKMLSVEKKGYLPTNIVLTKICNKRMSPFLLSFPYGYMHELFLW
jgi:hypothetical protein